MTVTLTRHHLIAIACLVIAFAIGIAIGLVFAGDDTRPIVIQRHIHSVAPLKPYATPTPEPLPECMNVVNGGSWHWHPDEWGMNSDEIGAWDYHEARDCR